MIQRTPLKHRRNTWKSTCKKSLLSSSPTPLLRATQKSCIPFTNTATWSNTSSSTHKSANNNWNSRFGDYREATWPSYKHFEYWQGSSVVCARQNSRWPNTVCGRRSSSSQPVATPPLGISIIVCSNISKTQVAASASPSSNPLPIQEALIRKDHERQFPQTHFRL